MATNSEIIAFIDLFSKLACSECARRIQEGQPFVLPSVALAQSALESDWGQAGLMKKANAFFGVKAGGSWTGKIYVADTWEVAENGESYNTVANFRAYDTPAESMADYYNLVCGLSRYSKAWSYGTEPSLWLTARQTIEGIHAGGYATDNLYINKIMNTINGRDLTKIDPLILTADPATGELNLPSVNWLRSDFVRGYYVGSDGGESIEMSTLMIQDGFAIKWDKRYIAQQDLTLTVPDFMHKQDKGYFEYWLIRDNVATHHNITLSTIKNIELKKNDVFVLQITFNDNQFTDINQILDSDITFSNNKGIPIEEKEGTTLAYFVKVE